VKVFEDLLTRLGPLGLVAPTVCEEIPPALAAENYAGLLKRCGTGQTILLDTQREVRGLYRVRQLPTSVLIGPDLKIVEVVRGVPPLRDPALHARIEALVRSLPSPPRHRSPARTAERYYQRRHRGGCRTPFRKAVKSNVRARG